MSFLAETLRILPAGIVGGAVSLLAKHWIDMKEERLHARRDQIQKWRNMVGRHVSLNSHGSFLHDPDFLSLRRHIDKKELGQIEGNSIIVVMGTQGIAKNYPLHVVQETIDKLEEKWKLL